MRSLLRRLQFEGARRAAAPALLRVQAALGKAGKGRKRNPLFGPPLRAEARLREMMSVHYLAGRWADGAVPVAWVTSGAPVEILRPLGYHVVYPENHAALCGARHMAMPLLQRAEAEGYSQDLCGYFRCDMGSCLGGATPAGRLPRPDLLVCCTNICQTVLYWYRDLARRFRAPIALVDTPFIYGEPSARQMSYVEAQLYAFAETAARVAGRRMDEAELAGAALLGRDAALLWGQCLETAKAKPAPWSAFDQFVHMAVVVAMRGTRECVSYYKELLDELRDRVKAGVGGIMDERRRLLWDNLPVWHRMGHLAKRLAANGFHLVASTYANAWAETARLLGETDPWRGMAKAYTHVILNRDLPNRLKVMKNLVQIYDCDGVILHGDRSCKSYSFGQAALKERLAAECGVKAMLLEADHVDERLWADEAVETRLAAFMESFG